MRVSLLLGLASVALMAAKDNTLHIEKANQAAFVGYSEDAKAEKNWELRAEKLLPVAGKKGIWDLEKIVLTTFRDAKAGTVMRTDAGRVEPEKGLASGEDEVTVAANNFQLEGKGWNWQTTPKGDILAIRTDVRATLLSTKKGEEPIKVTAARVDVAPNDKGITVMTFSGNVLLERGTERLSCERVVCLLSSDRGSCERLDARGNVLHINGPRALSAEQLIHDLKEEKMQLTGNVRVADPEFEIQATSVNRDTTLGVTECLSDTLVRIRILPVKDRTEAVMTGRHVVVAPGTGKSGLTIAVDGGAEYTAEGTRLRANDILVRAGEEGDGPISANGNVDGVMGQLKFASEQARLDRVIQRLDLSGNPRLKDARGFDVAGFSMVALLAQERVTVESGPGLRAAMRIRSATGPVEAEAERITLSRKDERSTADLRGSVQYRMNGAKATCDRLIALAEPTEGTTNVELTQASLSGSVHYTAPGFSALSDRAEIHPAIGVEASDITGKPMLLYLQSFANAPATATRPRIEIASGEGIAAFTADRHQVLFSEQVARFVLNGSVKMASGDTQASCGELIGSAKRDDKGKFGLVGAAGTIDVRAEVGGSRAKGESIEIKPAAKQVILSGNARIEDREGRVGIPAESLTFDTTTRNWRMDSVRSKTGSPVRPKILLPDAGFTLPVPQ